jgi:outer membrane protein assembly factor BamB
MQNLSRLFPSLRIFTAIFLSLPLIACSYLPDWIGDNKTKSLKGHRLAVLRVDEPIEPLPSLAQMEVILPPPEANTYWPNSSNVAPSGANHLALSKQLSLYKRVKIGKGGDELDYLSVIPIAVENQLVTLDAKGFLTKWNIENSIKPVWRVSLPLPKKQRNVKNGGVTAVDNILYVTSGNNIVFAYQLSDGALIWKKEIAGIAREAPAFDDGRVFVSTMENTLYALDAKNGSVVWSKQGPNEELAMRGNAAPIAAGGLVFMAQSSGDLVALDSRNGDEVWGESLAQTSKSVPDAALDIDTPPVLSSERLYASSYAHVFAAMDPASGARLWEKPFLAKNPAWVAEPFVFVLSEQPYLLCLHAVTGGVRWSLPLPGFKNPKTRKNPIGWKGPVLAGDRLWIVSSAGDLVAVSPQSGEVMTRYRVGKDIFLPPIIVSERLFLLQNNGNLSMFGAADSNHSELKKYSWEWNINAEKKSEEEIWMPESQPSTPPEALVQPDPAAGEKEKNRWQRVKSWISGD